MRRTERNKGNMKKYPLKIAVFYLIPALFLANLLCCHFPGIKSVQAADFRSVSMLKTEKAVPSCHAQPNKTPAPVKRECSCCITQQLQADPPAKISLHIPQSIIGYLSVSVLPSAVFVLKDQFNLAFLNGPPGPISKTPLYIHLHNFRI